MARAGFLLNNLPYKIISLVVALIVWFQVTESLEFEEVVEAPLRIVSLPPRLALAESPPSHVRVHVRARGRFIGLRTKGISVPLDFSGAQVGRVTRLLSTADVEVPAGVRAQVVRILAPTVVAVEFDSLATRWLPVVPIFEGGAAEGYVQAGEPAVKPSHVMVRGPERFVRNLGAIRTKPVNIGNARTAVNVQTNLSLEGMYGVSAEPVEVVVSVPVEREEEFRVEGIPVRVLVAGIQGRVAWEPREVTLEVRGARALYEKWEPQEIDLTIIAGALPVGYHEFVVEPASRHAVRLIPLRVGPPPPGTIGGQGTRTGELRGVLPLPGFLALSGVSPRNINILVE